RNVDAKMLLEISPGARFWRLGSGFVVVSVLRNRDFARGEKNGAWGENSLSRRVWKRHVCKWILPEANLIAPGANYSVFGPFGDNYKREAEELEKG
ncbi:hypothetical protein A2U01_0063663, partial [Trifolium medium]|nr:hypothetical protein [Trifolium medium]